MRDESLDGSTIIRWVIVLPVFVFTYIFLRTLLNFTLDKYIFGSITSSREGLHIIEHIYRCFFCLILSIYGSVQAAPAKRVTVAAVIMCLGLIMTPKAIEVALEYSRASDLYWERKLVIWLAVGCEPGP
ncbi:MAG: hypothetical protein K0Q59_3018 [Paenibacillus sp.]|nr:hypothetical protein [Paenibacillus sp.]